MKRSYFTLFLIACFTLVFGQQHPPSITRNLVPNSDFSNGPVEGGTDLPRLAPPWKKVNGFGGQFKRGGIAVDLFENLRPGINYEFYLLHSKAESTKNGVPQIKRTLRC